MFRILNIAIGLSLFFANPSYAFERSVLSRSNASAGSGSTLHQRRDLAFLSSAHLDFRIPAVRRDLDFDFSAAGARVSQRRGRVYWQLEALNLFDVDVFDPQDERQISVPGELARQFEILGLDTEADFGLSVSISIR